MKLTPYILAAMLACGPLAFVHPVRVSGKSMEPALQEGQVALAAWAWCSGSPSLGEIRIIKGPEGTAIKRILALPGQALEQRNGYFMLDGKIIEEPYVSMRGIGSGGPWSSGAGYLMIGDNRPASRDSRLWGPIQGEAIGGKVLFGRSRPKT
jgi:signal peptidase I